MMGGKSLKRSWSAEEIEKQLKKVEEKPKGKSLAKAFKKEVSK